MRTFSVAGVDADVTISATYSGLNPVRTQRCATPVRIVVMSCLALRNAEIGRREKSLREYSRSRPAEFRVTKHGAVRQVPSGKADVCYEKSRP